MGSDMGFCLGGLDIRFAYRGGNDPGDFWEVVNSKQLAVNIKTNRESKDVESSRLYKRK